MNPKHIYAVIKCGRRLQKKVYICPWFEKALPVQTQTLDSYRVFPAFDDKMQAKEWVYSLHRKVLARKSRKLSINNIQRKGMNTNKFRNTIIEEPEKLRVKFIILERKYI